MRIWTKTKMIIINIKEAFKKHFNQIKSNKKNNMFMYLSS